MKFSRESLTLFDDTLDEIIYNQELKKNEMIRKKEDISQITSINGGYLMPMTDVTIIL